MIPGSAPYGMLADGVNRQDFDSSYECVGCRWFVRARGLRLGVSGRPINISVART